MLPARPDIIQKIQEPMVTQFSADSAAYRAVFEPDIDAEAVRREPFLVGEHPDVGGDSASPSRVTAIMLVRLRKSLEQSPEAQRAVPPVGSTCEGPAA